MNSNEKRVLFFIYTPAQAHTWCYVIQDLIGKGHKVGILARDYGSTIDILNTSGLEVSSIFRSRTRPSAKMCEIMVHLYKGIELSKEFDPSIVAGFGVLVAFIAKLVRKPSIVFTDSEPIHLQHYFTKLFSSVILAPNCFTKDLGKRYVRIEGYKELAYLHPNYFKPDPSIYDELKINRNEKYVILRFNVFDAVHDIGRHGFSTDDQIRLVKELGKYAHVFISPEGNLPKELENHRLPIKYDRIHHALYYAYLLVTDTQTMATESAILGTPAVRCNNFVGPNDMGNFIELEQKYGLIYSFREPEQAIIRAVELIQQADLKEQWAKKRQKLLADKIDVTKFLVEFIENYPESFNRYKKGNL